LPETSKSRGRPGIKGSQDHDLCQTQALHEKLIKIGAKVVRHGRYVTFQLDEVAISRRLFAEIPRLNDGPRPKPAPT
jgi:hypothetical protein